MHDQLVIRCEWKSGLGLQFHGNAYIRSGPKSYKQSHDIERCKTQAETIAGNEHDKNPSSEVSDIFTF